MNDELTVTVGIVALNEERYLPSLLKDIVKQTYSHDLIEVLLIDSCSSDSTLDIMQAFAQDNTSFKSIRVLSNPLKKQATGWNLAIDEFSCDVLVRIDAHTHLPENFIEKNVDLLNTGESITGGIRPCLIENETPWTKTLLTAENSMFGSSVNACRRSEKKQYVKTMFHAAYRKEVFDRVGKFNPNLGRTEDNELHWRMRNAGYRFCFDPEIVSYQYARSSFIKMIKQKFMNGYWVGLTLGVCPKCLSLFYFVPMCFVLAIVFSIILAMNGILLPIYLLLASYGSVAVLMSVTSIIKDGGNLYSILLPFLFLFLHVGYGVGTILGCLLMPFKRTKIKSSVK